MAARPKAPKPIKRMVAKAWIERRNPRETWISCVHLEGCRTEKRQTRTMSEEAAMDFSALHLGKSLAKAGGAAPPAPVETQPPLFDA